MHCPIYNLPSMAYTQGYKNSFLSKVLKHLLSEIYTNKRNHTIVLVNVLKLLWVELF